MSSKGRKEAKGPSVQYSGRQFKNVQDADKFMSATNISVSQSGSGALYTANYGEVVSAAKERGMPISGPSLKQLDSSAYVTLSDLEGLEVPGSKKSVVMVDNEGNPKYPPGTKVALSDLGQVPELRGYNQKALGLAVKQSGDAQIDTQVFQDVAVASVSAKKLAIQSNKQLSDSDRVSALAELDRNLAGLHSDVATLTKDFVMTDSVVGQGYLKDGQSPQMSAVVAPEAEPLGRFVDYTIGNRAPRQGYNTKVELVTLSGGLWARRDIPWAGGRVIQSLILQMSPDTFNLSSTKLTNRAHSLTRWVEEHWGDDVDQVSFSGKTFGFLFLELGYVQRGWDGDPNPYKELRHLANIFKGSGLEYQQADANGTVEPREFYAADRNVVVRKIVNHPRAGMIKRRDYVRISFDFVDLIGYFESFDVTDNTDGSPFYLPYNVTFKSELTLWK